MKLMIKQRVFSWGEKFDIYDQEGNVKYFVKGEVFSLGHQLHVFDLYDNEVGTVQQQLFRLLPKFDIVVNGEVKGTITKKFTFFKQEYEVDFKGWYVQGDFPDWNYQVYSSIDRPVITITKEWLAWGDTYVIDIENPADELMGVMLVLAIDAANCTHND